MNAEVSRYLMPGEPEITSFSLDLPVPERKDVPHWALITLGDDGVLFFGAYETKFLFNAAERIFSGDSTFQLIALKWSTEQQRWVLHL